MKATIDAVKSIKYGVEVSGKNFNVPKTTLRRKVLDKNKVAKGANRSFLGGAITVFTPEEFKVLWAELSARFCFLQKNN